jgi:protein TonB
MRQFIHTISAPASRWTTERVVGAGFVGLLHVIAIYALVTGLVPKIVKVVVPDDLTVTMDPVQQPKQDHVIPPKPTNLPTLPTEPTVPIPVFQIADDTAQTTAKQMPDRVTSIAPDTAASSISTTHTTPPYPGMARKMGEQGTVKLRLTISPQGTVTVADIVQSSGFPDLDQTAVGWVLSYWKYKPAVQGGMAVTSTALAAVVFNLKNAR